MAKTGSITITTNSQDVSKNTSNITVKGIIVTTGDSYRGDHRTGTYTITQGRKTIQSGSFTHGAPENSTTTLFSVTLTVNHNADGTSGTIVASFNYDSGWCTANKSTTLATIKRNSIFGNISGATIGSNMTVNITRYVSSYTHNLYYRIGNSGSWTTAATGVGTSSTFVLNMDLCYKITSSTTGSLQLLLRTYNGNTQIGIDVYKYVTVSVPASIIPTVSISVRDAKGYSNIYQNYIKGLSAVGVTITASGSYSSSISTYSTVIDGKTYTTSSVTSNILTSTGKLTVKTTVKDSRGRTASASIDISVIDYIAPQITSATARRCDEDGKINPSGNYLRIDFSSKVTALNNKNSAVYKVEYKKTTDKSYGHNIILSDYANNYSVSNGYCIFAIDSVAYNVILTVTDDFNSTPKQLNGSSLYKFFSFFKHGLGLALGKIAELSGVFDIGLKTKFSGGILQPVISNGTDLNNMLIPNTYTGNADAKYLNCPTTREFVLEVLETKDDGSIMQRLTIGSKSEPATYERIYYGESWGDWLCVSRFGNNILWSGIAFMNGSQTISLPEPISKQPNGVVFAWNVYTDTDGDGDKDETDYGWVFFFVPKYHTSAWDGRGVRMCDAYYKMRKYLYVYDEEVKGYSGNGISGTENGIAYDNTNMVLRYIAGV